MKYGDFLLYFFAALHLIKWGSKIFHFPLTFIIKICNNTWQLIISFSIRKQQRVWRLANSATWASHKGGIYSQLSFRKMLLLGMVSEVKVSQLCLTLCDCTDYTVHRILQARIPEWVGFPFSRDLPKPEIEPRSPALQVDSLPSEP